MNDDEVTKAYAASFDDQARRANEALDSHWDSVRDKKSDSLEQAKANATKKPGPDTVWSVPSIREEVLKTATAAIMNDRNNTHGDPSQDFTRTADLWTALGFSFNGAPIGAHNVAMAMIALKISRAVWSPEHRDHWLDMAGYAACGYEAYVNHDITGGNDE